MTRWADRAGWSELAEDLRRHPLQLEQESLDPVLPGHHERPHRQPQ
jgi:hypothetical protein